MSESVTTPISRMIYSAVSCTKCGSKGIGSCKCWINLECPKCGQRRTVERLDIDNPKAVKVLVPCPECSSGDFVEQIYLDANGATL